MLTPQAVEELYKVLSRLKENGLAIIFITHKLHEAAFLGDRISVLRRGQLIGTLDEPAVKAATPQELEKRIVEMMFGDAAGGLADAAELKAELSATDDLVYEAEPVRAAAEEVLKLERVSVRGEGAEPGLDDVSLTLHLGEILGVAGVDGNGQRALAETVSGQRRLQRGELRFFGAPIGHVGVTGRQKLGLRYLTDDRLGEGIVSGLPVSINMFLKRIGEAPFWRQGRIRKQAIDDRAKELVERFDVRTPSVDTRAGTLSGGNVQKVLLARELSFDSKVVIFHKPTYGLDLKTTRSVRQMIREMRDGKAALVISTDLDELLEVSDRIAVLSRGRIVGEVKPGPGAAEEVGRLMIGDVSLGAEPERGAA
jgi:simple sugar transport system ATP-binding protein